jgi:hypothetical protein
MRKSRIAIAPLPNGKGFSVSRRAASVLALALVFAPVSGRAATNVPVTLRTATLAYANADVVCQVSVPSGSDGLAVLNAAIAKNCVKAYEITTFGQGKFLQCLDDGINGNRCGDPGPGYLRYWAFREDCNYVQDHGLEGFVATPNKELSLTYEISYAFAVPAITTAGKVCS